MRKLVRGGRTGGWQTNTLALLYDCVPEGRKETVIKIAARAKDGKYFFGAPAFRAVGEPEKNAVRDGIVMTGSPFFLFFISHGMPRAYAWCDPGFFCGYEERKA